MKVFIVTLNDASRYGLDNPVACFSTRELAEAFIAGYVIYSVDRLNIHEWQVDGDGVLPPRPVRPRFGDTK